MEISGDLDELVNKEQSDKLWNIYSDTVVFKKTWPLNSYCRASLT